MFDTLFAFINQITTQNVGNLVGVFSSTIAPLLGACVILYAIYLAYQSLYQPENLIIMESVKFIGSLVVVTFISFNTAWYVDNIVPTVFGTGDQIAQALLGNPPGGSIASLQIILDQMIKTIFDMISSIELSKLPGKTWIDAAFIIPLSFLLALASTLFLFVAASYLALAKIMVSFLLIIGPLFIMMSFFPSTRSFFQAWTGQLFNYTLLSILYPLTFTMFIQILDATVFSDNQSIATYLMTIIIFGMLILISVQIPTFCSTLSGGIGISGLVGNMVGGMKSMVMGGVAGAKMANKGRKTLDNYVRNKGKGTIKPG